MAQAAKWEPPTGSDGGLTLASALPAAATYDGPTRDGVGLATTVYLPEGEGLRQAIATGTPYNEEIGNAQS